MASTAKRPDLQSRGELEDNAKMIGACHTALKTALGLDYVKDHVIREHLDGALGDVEAALGRCSALQREVR